LAGATGLSSRDRDRLLPIGSKTHLAARKLPIDRILAFSALLLPIDHMIADSSKTYGDQLRERRRLLRLSQANVADAIGTNRRVIGELESGKPTVQLQIAIDAARAVGLDITLAPRR
jgi:DNA-binding XRE family transcriptional regulator